MPLPSVSGCGQVAGLVELPARNRRTTGVEGAPKSSIGSTMRNVVTPSSAWSNSRHANRKACRWSGGREKLEEANAFGKAER